ncbi:MAG: hypothetical protein QXP36_07670 [Conexivisphaerales archaeon]
MTMQYYPIHITHIVVSLIWGISLIAINGIEFYFNKSIQEINLFWIILQNIGIASANSYWLMKTHISPSELTISTTKP